MYIAVTGSKKKENGKSSSRIYKKLGKYNTLLEHFDKSTYTETDNSRALWPGKKLYPKNPGDNTGINSKERNSNKNTHETVAGQNTPNTGVLLKRTLCARMQESILF